MKTLKLLFLLPLSIWDLSMTAQIGDLLRNKDIKWMAETYNDFAIDKVFENRIVGNKSRATPLKFVNKSDEILEEKFAVQKWLMAAAENGQMPVYQDVQCQKKINPDSLGNWGTVTTIDLNTYNTVYNEILQRYGHEYIGAFRAYQVIYYNAKKAKFGIRTLAVAPLYGYEFYRYSENRMYPKSSPLFWFKPKDLTSSRRLSKRQITWAKHMNLYSGVSMEADSIQILKNTLKTKPIDDLLSIFENKSRTPFYKRDEGLNPTTKISFSERKKLAWRIDTVAFISTEGYPESYKVVHERVKADELPRLQLIQNWYWDSRKERLEIYLFATAPLIDEMIHLGDLTFYKPLFYRRTN